MEHTTHVFRMEHTVEQPAARASALFFDREFQRSVFETHHLGDISWQPDENSSWTCAPAPDSWGIVISLLVKLGVLQSPEITYRVTIKKDPHENVFEASYDYDPCLAPAWKGALVANAKVSFTPSCGCDKRCIIATEFELKHDLGRSSILSLGTAPFALRAIVQSSTDDLWSLCLSAMPSYVPPPK